MAKITPILKINSLLSDRDKYIKCLEVFYKIIHLVFGLDFGFIRFQFKGIKYIPKVWAFLLGIFLCACTFGILFSYLILNWFVIVRYFVTTFQYILFVLALLQIKEEHTFYNLIHNLRTIDVGLKVHHESHRLNFKLFFAIFICFAYRLIKRLVYYGYYSICVVCVWDIILYIETVFAADVVRVTYAFMFYTINCRLKKIESLLKTNQPDFISIQYLYKSIVDIAEEHKKSFDPVLIMALLCNVPQVMATVYKIVQEILKSGTMLSLFQLSYDYMSILEMLSLTVMPAICAGMLTTEANKIKLYLHELLLQVKDDKQYRDIERFIGYVGVRSCRFRVCKVIPLDADLLGMVLSFCITYLIVIIQFTYK